MGRKNRKSEKSEKPQARRKFGFEELERRILLSTLTGVDPDSDAWAAMEQLHSPAPIEQDLGESDSGADSAASTLR